MKAKYRFLVFFSLLFAVNHNCKAIIIAKCEHKIGLYAGVGHSNTENPGFFYAVIINYGSCQVSRIYSPRSVDYGKALFHYSFNRNFLTNTVVYGLHSRNSGFTQLRQLILFPFHVFW